MTDQIIRKRSVTCNSHHDTTDDRKNSKQNNYNQITTNNKCRIKRGKEQTNTQRIKKPNYQTADDQLEQRQNHTKKKTGNTKQIKGKDKLNKTGKKSHERNVENTREQHVNINRQN